MIFNFRMRLIEAPDKYRIYINDNETIEGDLNTAIAILETEIKEQDPEFKPKSGTITG